MNLMIERQTWCVKKYNGPPPSRNNRDTVRVSQRARERMKEKGKLSIHNTHIHHHRSYLAPAVWLGYCVEGSGVGAWQLHHRAIALQTLWCCGLAVVCVAFLVDLALLSKLEHLLEESSERARESEVARKQEERERGGTYYYTYKPNPPSPPSPSPRYLPGVCSWGRCCRKFR